MCGTFGGKNLEKHLIYFVVMVFFRFFFKTVKLSSSTRELRSKCLHAYLFLWCMIVVYIVYPKHAHTHSTLISRTLFSSGGPKLLHFTSIYSVLYYSLFHFNFFICYIFIFIFLKHISHKRYRLTHQQQQKKNNNRKKETVE